jgi:glycosyltransferase involved in cell wall biosynthesis
MADTVEFRPARSGEREFLLDVSRLIWRFWKGQLPTGIDRVCLEYVAHFRGRSQALIQFGKWTFVLAARESDRLFAVLLKKGGRNRASIAAVILMALLKASRRAPEPGMIALNVGHTGLHNRALLAWMNGNEVRPIYLIHDLIPVTHPQFCRTGEMAKHTTRMENALISGAGIIANSQATLADLASFASDRGVHMPPSVVAWIAGYRLRSGISPQPPESPYFVTVGTIEARKNHLLLLEVWRGLVRAMGEKAPLLIVIGQRGWEAEEAIASLDRPAELQGHVREIGSCGDEELAAWIAGARALLMPSFVEGFGLPVIEALEIGTPVIASDLPVYREIVGDIPTYLDPSDVAAWHRVVQAFISDNLERQRQLARIPSYRAPTWDDHFAKVEKWLATDVKGAR